MGSNPNMQYPPLHRKKTLTIPYFSTRMRSENYYKVILHIFFDLSPPQLRSGI